MRLTNGDRDAIVRRVLEVVMEPRKKALAKTGAKLGAAVLAAALGKHKRAYFALPEQFQHIDDDVKVIVQGLRIYLPLGKRQPTTESWINVSGELATQVESYMAEKSAIERDESTLRQQARSVVMAATTAKQLTELWPAGSKYYGPLISETKQLPVSVRALEEKISACAA